MSTSPITGLPTTTALDVLANAAATAAQTQSQIEFNAINADLQKQLQTKITALENAPDDAVVAALQAQVSPLQQQASAATSIGSKFGGNANILADLQNQLADLQTAASAGDAAGFDNALAAANIDVVDLAVIPPVAPYQPDQIDALKTTGLGIGSSSSYDLSTPAGQAAAAAAVQAAQDLIGQIFAVTSSNQIIAGSKGTALTTQVNALTSQLNQLQQTDQTSVLTQIQQLTQQAQNQSHLIELALGNTFALSTALAQAANPPQPTGSPFGALENTQSSTGAQSAPPALSLLT
ncbi:MAG TPA: hypothetical protein VFA22_00420 [Stellaceae bacterium]|nr:hypothetical protein [Stellaceae bacterium]